MPARAAGARGQICSTSSVDHHASTAREDLLIDVTGRSPGAQSRPKASDLPGAQRTTARERVLVALDAELTTGEDRGPTNRRPAAPTAQPKLPQVGASARREPPGSSVHAHGAARPHRGPTGRREAPPPAQDQHKLRPESTTSHQSQKSPPVPPDARSLTDPQETPASRRSRLETQHRQPTAPGTKPRTEAGTAAQPSRAPTTTRTRQPPTRPARRSTAPPNADTSAPSAATRLPRPIRTRGSTATDAQQTPPPASKQPAPGASGHQEHGERASRENNTPATRTDHSPGLRNSRIGTVFGGISLAAGLGLNRS